MQTHAAEESFPAGQFLIGKASQSRRPLEGAAQVRRFEFGDYRLDVAPPLRVTILEDAGGRPIAAVLGHAFVVDTGDRLSSKHVAAMSPAHGEQEFEALYERLFGAFVIVVRIEGQTFLYLDAGGALSAVYSRELECAGATAAAVLSPKEYAERFRADLYEELDVKNEGWFPAGLTAHRGVSRLLCSHRLHLETWTASRVWPKAAPVRSTDPEASIAALAGAVRANLKTVYSNFRASQALTAGLDSRTLLSLTRGFSSAAPTFTIDVGNEAVKLDLHVARKLVQSFGLAHRVHPVFDDPAVRARWRRRCGDAVGGDNAIVHTGLEGLTKDGFEAAIDGIGGEVARCFFWKDSDGPETTLTSEAITRRLGMPYAQEVCDAVDQWLRGLPPGGDAFFILDLAQLELRFSAWAFAQSYTSPSLAQFSPFLSRRTLNAMFSLPLETKRSEFGKAIIQLFWPELLATRINQWGDYRDALHPIRKAITNPYLVTKKIRKILAP